VSAADVILIAHALIAGFITLGFVAIPLGAWRGWRFVYRRGLRLAHLGGILFVAAEALLGVACPLTLWEDAVRGGGAAEQAGFIARGIRSLLYYDVPLWAFTVVYAGAAVLAVWLWRRVPPAGAGD
jgi:hypothetical protein